MSQDTKIITGFDSDPIRGTEDGKDFTAIEYHRVFEAIHHSLEVAENAFARSAKRDLNNRLKDRATMKGSPQDRPQWMCQASVTIYFPVYEPEKMKEKSEETSRHLVGLVESVAQHLVSQLKDNEKLKVNFIDSLKVSVQEVGDCTYSFRIKQAWSRSEVE